MKPRIGINLDVRPGTTKQLFINSTYHDAVRHAGGISVLLPPAHDDELPHLLNGLAGVLLIGGKDYHPNSYGETPADTVELTDPMRQDFDFRLARLCLEVKLPLLGICAGHQLLNIALGGSLIQDIKTELGLQVAHGPECEESNRLVDHEVSLFESSTLRRIYGKERVPTKSSHHQAIRRLGKGLRAVAYADDGVIEAVEMASSSFTIGVQWHPERDLQNHLPLFKHFVQSCAEAAGGGTAFGIAAANTGAGSLLAPPL